MNKPLGQNRVLIRSATKMDKLHTTEALFNIRLLCPTEKKEGMIPREA